MADTSRNPAPTNDPAAKPADGQTSPLESTDRHQTAGNHKLPSDGLASGGNQGAELQRDWNEKKRT